MMLDHASTPAHRANSFSHEEISNQVLHLGITNKGEIFLVRDRTITDALRIPNEEETKIQRSQKLRQKIAQHIASIKNSQVKQLLQHYTTTENPDDLERLEWIALCLSRIADHIYHLRSQLIEIRAQILKHNALLDSTHSGQCITFVFNVLAQMVHMNNLVHILQGHGKDEPWLEEEFKKATNSLLTYKDHIEVLRKFLDNKIDLHSTPLTKNRNTLSDFQEIYKAYSQVNLPIALKADHLVTTAPLSHEETTSCLTSFSTSSVPEKAIDKDEVTPSVIEINTHPTEPTRASNFFPEVLPATTNEFTTRRGNGVSFSRRGNGVSFSNDDGKVHVNDITLVPTQDRKISEAKKQDVLRRISAVQKLINDIMTLVAAIKNIPLIKKFTAENLIKENLINKILINRNLIEDIWIQENLVKELLESANTQETKYLTEKVKNLTAQRKALTDEIEELEKHEKECGKEVSFTETVKIIFSILNSLKSKILNKLSENFENEKLQSLIRHPILKFPTVLKIINKLKDVQDFDDLNLPINLNSVMDRYTGKTQTPEEFANNIINSLSNLKNECGKQPQEFNFQKFQCLEKEFIELETAITAMKDLLGKTVSES